MFEEVTKLFDYIMETEIKQTQEWFYIQRIINQINSELK
jgi:hypothetical protein